MNHNKSVPCDCQEPSAPGLVPTLPGPEFFGEGESPSTFSRFCFAPGPGVSKPSDAPGPSFLSASRISAAVLRPSGLPSLPSDPSPKTEKKGIPGPLGGLPGGGPASGSAFYLEYVAKSHTAPGIESREEHGKREVLGRIPGRKIHREVRCGSWALVRACPDGHTFAKSLDCGREWCEKCRTSSHGRRMARWLPKLQKIKEMGYLVVTLPLSRRPRSESELQKIGYSVTGILRRRGFTRGLRRWHTHGEERSGTITPWAPHLNFLMDGGFLSEECLDSIKKAICGVLKAEKIVVYYQYTQDVSQIVHWLKYVTRPTFLKKEWDPDMAEELYNFRNSGWWGRWDDEDKWTLPEKEKKLAYFKKVEAGICPTCGKKLEGGHVVKVEDLLELPGWAQIWERVWQYKGPPENVLIYRLLKDFAVCEK